MKKILESKSKFNKFFREDLYGRFDNDKNIILSRGGWNDEFIQFPRILNFCINFALKKQWAGYSDSLGHKNALNALKRMLNSQGDYGYEISNLSQTLGNVVTIGVVFKLLKQLLGEVGIITFTPYYSPIIKSVNSYFRNVYFTSSLESEKKIIENILLKIKSTRSKILFLTNVIGVEGRTFSPKFWEEIINIVDANKMYLVIDEGMWFEKTDYPKSINQEFVIRIVSLSKKYGIPGCKIGFMVAGKTFMNKYYDFASTNYGGPLSIFFLFTEFLFQFEYAIASSKSKKEALHTLGKQYNIPIDKINNLFNNYLKVTQNNYLKFKLNYKIFLDWIKDNDKIECVYDSGGLNIFLKFKSKLKSYSLFEKNITQNKVSFLPSSCLGDEKDSMVRITLLEETKNFKRGLSKIKIS